MKAGYSLSFEADLNRRINPERSRHFDRKRFLASQKNLEKILAQGCFRKEDGIRIGVVGSNGKGSTAFCLASLAKLEKGKIGLFTSPHLLCVRERIRLRTQKSPRPQAISPRLAWSSLEDLKKLLGQEHRKLSYFEILTLLAAYIFRKENCALEIFEAGLGGRFDATRPLKAAHVILSPIEKEHTQILGANLRDILEEKLALLDKSAQSLFCMPQRELSQEDIESTARKFAPQIKIFFYEKGEKTRQSYVEENQNFARFVLRKLGIACQQKIKVEIPGRLEKRLLSLDRDSAKTKEIIFDAAHNPPAILRALTDLSLSQEAGRNYPQKSLVLLALLKDRPVKPNLLAVRKAGFLKIRQIIAANWRQAEEGLISLDAAHVGQLIRDELSERDLERAIFLGSHYSYPYFLKIFS